MLSAEVYLERLWQQMKSLVSNQTNQAYAPVSTHGSGPTISSAVTLTKPAGATQIMIQAITKNVRFRLDGTNPTASIGFQLRAGADPVIVYVSGTDIRVIQEEATASLQYQWLA
jgi:hypothetical protein